MKDESLIEEALARTSGAPVEPEEIAGIVLYLTSDLASFATGGVYVVDGGQTTH